MLWSIKRQLESQDSQKRLKAIEQAINYCLYSSMERAQRNGLSSEWFLRAIRERAPEFNDPNSLIAFLRKEARHAGEKVVFEYLRIDEIETEEEDYSSLIGNEANVRENFIVGDWYYFQEAISLGVGIMQGSTDVYYSGHRDATRSKILEHLYSLNRLDANQRLIEYRKYWIPATIDCDWTQFK